MFDASIPSHLWPDSVLTAVHLINLLPSPTTKYKSPYEILHHLKPDYTHLKVFGCSCYPLLPVPTRHKLQPRTIQCVFTGYPNDIKGYKCLAPNTGHIYLSLHVIFDELHFPFQQHQTTPTNTPTSSRQSPSVPLLLTPSYTYLNSRTIQPPPRPITTSSPSTPSDYPDTPRTIQPVLSPSPSPLSIPPPVATTNITAPSHPRVTRTKIGSIKPKTIFTLLHSSTSETTPTCFSQALKSPEWRAAMSQEFAALQTQGTWDLVPPPPSQTILGSKWTYRIKLHPNVTIARHKARLVAQSHKQEPGLDYHETFNRCQISNNSHPTHSSFTS